MIRFPWFAKYWADRFHVDGFGVDQTRGADGSLAERQTTIICRDLLMGEHNEILLFKALHHLFEEDAVLETSARQSDGIVTGCALASAAASQFCRHGHNDFR
jgi:1,4-alpha-glucan branching enzyme